MRLVSFMNGKSIQKSNNNNGVEKNTNSHLSVYTFTMMTYLIRVACVFHSSLYRFIYLIIIIIIIIAARLCCCCLDFCRSFFFRYFFRIVLLAAVCLSQKAVSIFFMIMIMANDHSMISISIEMLR